MSPPADILGVSPVPVPGSCVWPQPSPVQTRKGSHHTKCALRSYLLGFLNMFSPQNDFFSSLQSQLVISTSLWSFPGTASADWWLWKCNIFHFLLLDVKPAANGFPRVKLAAAGSGLQALKCAFAGEPPGLLAVSLVVITACRKGSEQSGCWAWLQILGFDLGSHSH